MSLTIGEALYFHGHFVIAQMLIFLAVSSLFSLQCSRAEVANLQHDCQKWNKQGCIWWYLLSDHGDGYVRVPFCHFYILYFI